MTFTKFKSITLSVPGLYRFTVDSLRHGHAVTLTFDSLTLHVFSVSAVTKSNSGPNLSEIEQSAVALSQFKYVQFGHRPPSLI